MLDRDAEMTDAATPPGDKISKKIKSLLKMDYKIKESFEISPVGRWELQSLRDSKAQAVLVPYSVGVAMPAMSRYDVKFYNKGSFLMLPCEPSHFYARSGYQELYECISKAWKTKKFRVTLIEMPVREKVGSRFMP